MHWFVLINTGHLEVAFTFCLGKARETTALLMWLWYTGFAVSFINSMLLLIKATQVIPLGTAYAIWTGIGALGTAIMGIVFFGESADVLRLFFLMMLIFSIIGLKIVSN